MSDAGRHLIAIRRRDEEREAHMRECSIIRALIRSGYSRDQAYREAASIVMGANREDDNGGPILEN